MPFKRREIIITQNYAKLILTALFVALCSALLAYSLKNLTEHFEEKIAEVAGGYRFAVVLLPTIGITAIYFLRKYLFQNRKNKGITEIYKTLDQRKEHLPFFKIPSHYLNGFLTVIFGGSTGIEVSTVVASATIGNATYEREFSARQYKRELICAGVVAGVAVLFNSPLAGWLFALEVIAKGLRKTVLISCTVAALAAWVFIYSFDNHSLLPFAISGWNWQAVPFFVVLSLLASVLAVYFTALVIKTKTVFAKIDNNFIRVNTGALIIGILILYFPTLYGDSYHGLKSILKEAVEFQPLSVGLLLLLVVLKPLAASLTLGAGGDGGVFAPSIVAGAFLGLAFAAVCNRFFGTDLVLLNFAMLGAATTLSAALYAPFTALILVCNLAPNGYALFFPMLLGSMISYLCAKKMLPYNVYTYDNFLTLKAQAE